MQTSDQQGHALSLDEQLAALTWTAAQVETADELRDKLALGRPLRVKLGLDPTAEHVTLGWSVPLLTLRRFQDLGHTAVLIVGDFTARIGDPSGQKDTRPMLSKEQVDAYAERVLSQFMLILRRDRLEIRRNSEWLEPLGTEGILRLASQHTVARMLERDDFAKRFEAREPISVTEFLYPLLQAYDSVVVAADVELGGTDQLFSLLTGREMQRRHGQPAQVVMTNPLIEGTDGAAKMSQSKGNYIAVTEAPGEMFGKLMSVPDQLMAKYFNLVTGRPQHECAAFERDLDAGAVHPNEAKRRLARAVVELYHGPDAATAAEEGFDALFKRREVPDEVPEAAIPDGLVNGDGLVDVARLLRETGLAASSSEARRILQEGGVRLDGEAVGEPSLPLDRLRGSVLQRGKRRFVRLV